MVDLLVLSIKKGKGSVVVTLIDGVVIPSGTDSVVVSTRGGKGSVEVFTNAGSLVMTIRVDGAVASVEEGIMLVACIEVVSDTVSKTLASVVVDC